MSTIIPPVKGTRDFYPDEMAIRTWLYQNIRQVSESYGYQEYEGPYLERVDLYAAKSGEELVNQQSYVFQDRGGDLITLRPELTPTLARMVSQRQNELVFPLRWWSFGPFWRYERPQRGRSREFFQWNIDLIGVNTPEADAELIAICTSFFQKVGLTPSQVKIQVNNRALMNAELELMGISAEIRPTILQAIDRYDKMKPAEWDSYLLDIGLSMHQLEKLKELLADSQLWKKWPEFWRFFAALEAMNAKDYVQYNAKVIRGLAYYTGFVFEVFDQDGGRSLFGGGRYDNLVSDVGGTPLPGVGFAMGDVMTSLVLKKYGLLPDQSGLKKTILVTVFDEAHLLSSQAMAAELRRGGLKAMCYPEAVKLPKQLKYADRMGIRLVIILGPDEIANDCVTIKDLNAHSQETVKRSQAAPRLADLLAHQPSM